MTVEQVFGMKYPNTEALIKACREIVRKGIELPEEDYVGIRRAYEATWMLCVLVNEDYAVPTYLSLPRIMSLARAVNLENGWGEVDKNSPAA